VERAAHSSVDGDQLVDDLPDRVDRQGEVPVLREEARAHLVSETLLKRFGTLIALLLLVLFNLAVTPHFATMQTLSVNLTQVCTIVIVGVGMTLVIATGGLAPLFDGATDAIDKVDPDLSLWGLQLIYRRNATR